jgi:hypothetical protein
VLVQPVDGDAVREPVTGRGGHRGGLVQDAAAGEGVRQEAAASSAPALATAVVMLTGEGRFLRPLMGAWLHVPSHRGLRLLV